MEKVNISIPLHLKLATDEHGQTQIKKISCCFNKDRMGGVRQSLHISENQWPINLGWKGDSGTDKKTARSKLKSRRIYMPYMYKYLVGGEGFKQTEKTGVEEGVSVLSVFCFSLCALW